MIIIRPCRLEDQEAMRQICIATSSMPVDTEKQRRCLVALYQDYYSTEEPENCFVAVNETDIPIGYILCAADYKTYRKKFRKKYAPILFRLNFALGFAALAGDPLERRLSKRYPAHLHIDILDGYQHQGVGRRLMETLTAHLKAKGIPGVQLGVGRQNKNGIAFYRHMGFDVLRNTTSCLYMGLRLDEIK